MPWTVTADVFSVDLEQRVEGVLEHDLAVEHGDRADGDDAVGARIQAGRLRIEHDEAHLLDRRVVVPGLRRSSAR